MEAGSTYTIDPIPNDTEEVSCNTLQYTILLQCVLPCALQCVLQRVLQSVALHRKGVARF